MQSGSGGALVVLDVSEPKIGMGMQSKYHGNIKVPSSMPQNKQTMDAAVITLAVPNERFVLAYLMF